MLRKGQSTIFIVKVSKAVSEEISMCRCIDLFLEFSFSEFTKDKRFAHRFRLFTDSQVSSLVSNNNNNGSTSRQTLDSFSAVVKVAVDK